jgi:hypothetical protein
MLSQRRGHEAVPYQPRHVACASICMSMSTSLEEGIKLHRFAGIFPEQFLTEARRHREAVVAADKRMVIRCFRDDFSGFVHDVSHAPIFGGSRAAALIWIMPPLGRWSDFGWPPGVWRDHHKDLIDPS